MKKSATAAPIRENVDLAPHTTLGVGGPARFLAGIKHEDQIPDALEFARARGCPVFILGGGSNILVSDAGFPGLVLRMEIRSLQHHDEDSSGFVSAAAGESWDSFVEHCVERNLAGVECLSGIPGSVGGAPVQNIGAYGEQIGDVILSIRVLDRETNCIDEMSGRECRFGYRSSIFNSTHRDRYIILKVAFSLRPYGKPRIEYPDLQDHFEGRTKPPSLGEVRRTVIHIRDSKGMLLTGSQTDQKSVGSFFKNPVLLPEKAEEIENRFRQHGLLAQKETLPRFAAPEGGEKLPAALLIEHAGFAKGYISGNVGISPKHNLAFINRGDAKAAEFIDLMHRVRDRVLSEFGILLQPEPTLLGFDVDV